MSSIPKTMKGIVIEKNGGAEVLQYRTDLLVPTPQEGQVLVHNEYCGVNFIDTEWETHGLKQGDHVVCLSEGAYAEYTAAPALRTVVRPHGISSSIAAAGFQQGLTALTLIREAHKVNKGDWVLVHAASGGTGLWLVQLLKVAGANTIGTASTIDKMELAKQAGATHVINYTHEDVRSRVQKLTENNGVRVVFDGVGKSTFDLSLSLVARKGSMISFGNASGTPDPFNVARLSTKNVRLMRPVLLSFLETREEFSRYAEELFDLVLRHKLQVHYRVYSLSDAAQAQQALEARETMGKLILDTST